EIKSEKGRINFKHIILRENPKTLFADCSHNRTVTNLLFHTDHTTAWHTAVTGISAIRQRKASAREGKFEDSKKDQENRILTVNMYQNGTVTVQGSTPTAGAQAQTHTTGLSSPLPAFDHQSQDHTTISLLRDGLALLEVSSPPSYTTSNPDTELLQDQIYQCRTQLKNSVQELRESLTTELEEVKVTMRREPHHRA
ncbi:unnamed protein product, partial [Coregonus sp. 'balchen']